MTFSLSPIKLCNVHSRVEIPALRDLVSRVPRIYIGNTQDNDDWRILNVLKLPTIGNNISEFYVKLIEIKDIGDVKFKLPLFAMQLLLLPTSNCEL